MIGKYSKKPIRSLYRSNTRRGAAPKRTKGVDNGVREEEGSKARVPLFVAWRRGFSEPQYFQMQGDPTALAVAGPVSACWLLVGLMTEPPD